MSIGGLLIDKESSTDEPPVFPEDWNPRVDKLPGTEGMARVLVYLCMVADSGATQVITRKGEKDM